jgi:protein gp37
MSRDKEFKLYGYADFAVNPVPHINCSCEVKQCWWKDGIYKRFHHPLGFFLERLDDKISATGKSKVIVIQYAGDLFHESVEDYWLSEIFERLHTMNLAREQAGHGCHKFLILTKWPERMFNFLNDTHEEFKDYLYLGTTITGKHPKIDIRRLIEISKFNKVGFKTWLSIEPLYHNLSLQFGCYTHKGVNYGEEGFEIDDDHIVDQVIVGCDTSAGAPEPNLDWFRSIRDQCYDAGVPLFVKKVTKKTRLLDNVEYNDLVWDK